MAAVWSVTVYVTVQNDEVEVASFPDYNTATSRTIDLSVLLDTRKLEVSPFEHTTHP
jgi:hypothetical protein